MALKPAVNKQAANQCVRRQAEEGRKRQSQQQARVKINVRMVRTDITQIAVPVIVVGTL